MFRKMRRKEYGLTQAEAESILANGSHGVLALDGDEGYTYALPVNYAYENNKIYFHSATAGHKIDAIKKNDKVSFCVVAKDYVIPEKFDTNYRSAIAFGKIRILENDDEKQNGLEALIRRFSPDYMEKGKEEIKKEWDIVAVIEIEIEHLTAKEGR